MRFARPTVAASHLRETSAAGVSGPCSFSDDPIWIRTAAAALIALATPTEDIYSAFLVLIRSAISASRDGGVQRLPSWCRILRT